MELKQEEAHFSYNYDGTITLLLKNMAIMSRGNKGGIMGQFLSFLLSFICFSSY